MIAEWAIVFLAASALVSIYRIHMLEKRVRSLEGEVRNLHIYNVKGPLHHERTSSRP